jgi:hypothetical protein
MTPQDKAMELMLRYYELIPMNTISFAKQCALIAVDEILDLNLGLSNCDENNWDIDNFYLEVKQEIEKL